MTLTVLLAYNPGVTSGNGAPGNPPQSGGAGRRRSPTIFQRAVVYLKTHPGQALCAKCLSAVLGLSTSAGHNVMPRLEGHSVFLVHHAACSRCGRRRLTVSTKPATG